LEEKEGLGKMKGAVRRLRGPELRKEVYQ